MKPRLLTILLLLLAGAVVNVGVAWGCSADPPTWFGGGHVESHMRPRPSKRLELVLGKLAGGADDGQVANAGRW